MFLKRADGSMAEYSVEHRAKRTGLCDLTWIDPAQNVGTKTNCSPMESTMICDCLGLGCSVV